MLILNQKILYQRRKKNSKKMISSSEDYDYWMSTKAKHLILKSKILRLIIVPSYSNIIYFEVLVREIKTLHQSEEAGVSQKVKHKPTIFFERIR